MRSASGVFRYARRTGDDNLLEKAQLSKELALAAPMKDGIFPSVIRVPNQEVEIDGEKYRRPKGWDEAYWTNSNRRPYNYGIKSDWYHILDSSWTCLQMLNWYNELEQDRRLIDYCRAYADRLLELQDKDGFFPGWLDPETYEPGPVMNQTPETSMSVTFLIKLAEATGDKRYSKAALKAMNAVLEEIVPGGRWEDYETYWSCCGWGSKDYLGKKIERNGLYKQNNLSIYWTAEALLECYHITGKSIYLEWGKRTIDELSMYQQVWQPPFIYVPALGGFGVMNADGEWNDSRETLFAELYLRYYKETGDPHLFERGVTALKSGFIMMYCPENPRAKKQWEKRYSWFGPEDYGFTIENYGHGGRTSPEGGGVGSFTIYDWGNGAASEARNRIYDHFGDVYIDLERNTGFGIDSISVDRVEDGWMLKDFCGEPREIKIVFNNGKEIKAKLNGTYLIND
jgi:rhamnogalacturonyl hydrolase YesR